MNKMLLQLQCRDSCDSFSINPPELNLLRIYLESQKRPELGWFLTGPAPGWGDWGGRNKFGGAREVYLCEFDRGTGAQFILVWIKRTR